MFAYNIFLTEYKEFHASQIDIQGPASKIQINNLYKQQIKTADYK